PEQSSKTLRLLNELQAGRNNFFYVKISRDRGPATIGRKRDQKLNNQTGNEVKRRGANSASEIRLHKRTQRFLVSGCVIWVRNLSREVLRARCWLLTRICSIRISGGPCSLFPSMTQTTGPWA